MGLEFGSETYRAGAQERIEEARRLLEAGHFAGCTYLAGRAVEGMLRALCSWKGRQLETGHDLKRLAARVSALGLLRPGGKDDDFIGAVQEIGRLWSNNLRYAGIGQLEKHWRALGVFGRGGAHTVKEACNQLYHDCYTVFQRCELLWQRARKARSIRSRKS